MVVLAKPSGKMENFLQVKNEFYLRNGWGMPGRILPPITRR